MSCFVFQNECLIASLMLNISRLEVFLVWLYESTEDEDDDDDDDDDDDCTTRGEPNACDESEGACSLSCCDKSCHNR